jgi:hypothetical protein
MRFTILSSDIDEDADNRPSNPAALLAEAALRLNALEQVFQARGDEVFLQHITELRAVLRRLQPAAPGKASV